MPIVINRGHYELALSLNHLSFVFLRVRANLRPAQMDYSKLMILVRTKTLNTALTPDITTEIEKWIQVNMNQAFILDRLLQRVYET